MVMTESGNASLFIDGLTGDYWEIRERLAISP
jgi:hypothetical protein